MDATWMEVGGLLIRSPVTAGTNLLLAMQCAFYFWVLRTSNTRRAGNWGNFFLMMSIATLAGVFKHGARHLLGPTEFGAILATSNMGGALSTYFAQRATIASHAPTKMQRGLETAVGTQLFLFTAANVWPGPEIVLLIANSALGLLPVMAIEAVRRRMVRGAASVSAGLAVSILTGVVYAADISPAQWFNHIDLAHALMGLSFVMVYHGVRRESTWT